MKIQFMSFVGLAISFISPVLAQQTVDPQLAQQMRAFATKYDVAINERDTSAIAALYTKGAIWRTSNEGAFRGQQAIANEYQKLYFTRWNIHDYATTVRRLAATGDEVLSTGTWSCSSSEGGGRKVSGTYSWVLVNEGKTLKIRLDNH
jgi:ketosteroid isomerase-like protein